MENNQKYIKVKCNSEQDYEAILNYCKKNLQNMKVKAKPKKLVIRIPLSTNDDRAAEEMDLFVDAINTFVCPEDKVKYKLKTYTKEHTGTFNIKIIRNIYISKATIRLITKKLKHF